MIARFHPSADQELKNAVSYYESCQTGLGAEFIYQIEVTIKRIKNNPLAWPVMTDEIRRCLVKRFPFAVIYAIVSDELVVLAIMHLRREPGYWQNRI